jgi:hypothetical protein
VPQSVRAPQVPADPRRRAGALEARMRRRRAGPRVPGSETGETPRDVPGAARCPVGSEPAPPGAAGGQAVRRTRRSGWPSHLIGR